MNEFNVINNTGLTKKCLVKMAVLFTAGAGTGFGIANLLLKKKYEQIAMDEMNAYREYILDQLDGGEPVSKEDIPENVVITTPEMEAELHGELDDADKKEYNIVAGKYSQDLNADKAEKIGTKPYEIDEETFEQDNGFDKNDLFYYTEDDALVNHQDNIVSSPVFVVGEAVMNKLQTEDLNELFVRNETFGIDYIVTVVEESYSQKVLGYPNE